MYQKYKYKTQNKCSFSLQIYRSLSHMRYTQVSFCVQMRNTPPLFILYLPLDFFTNRSAPTNLLGWLHLGRHDTIILYSRGFYWPDLQQIFYLMTLWWPNTIITSQWRNRTSPIDYNSKNTFRILFEVTKFQHSPLMRRVFYWQQQHQL